MRYFVFTCIVLASVAVSHAQVSADEAEARLKAKEVARQSQMQPATLPSTAQPGGIPDQTSLLLAQIAALQKEVDALQVENAALKKLVPVVVQAEPKPPATEPSKEDAQEIQDFANHFIGMSTMDFERSMRSKQQYKRSADGAKYVIVHVGNDGKYRGTITLKVGTVGGRVTAGGKIVSADVQIEQLAVPYTAPVPFDIPQFKAHLVGMTLDEATAKLPSGGHLSFQLVAAENGTMTYDLILARWQKLTVTVDASNKIASFTEETNQALRSFDASYNPDGSPKGTAGPPHEVNRLGQ